ncbi:ABC transporter permease [Brevibacterium sp.]|uniref:ABC transporter permease n=1 Tax=Brevibacterium sp. TaxID=1701 RepID=UPI002811C585|nr:ABC transporter permease [Brevibacterium sp.]
MSRPRERRARPRISRHGGAPGWLWLPAAVGVAFLLLPIIGLTARIDIAHLGEVLVAPESRLAMGVSLGTSLIAAIVCVLIGFPLGCLLGSRPFRGHRILRTLILLPLVLPPVVSGLALLYTFGRTALIGSALDSAGLGLAYTSAAVVFAQVFVSLPFMVMSVETAVAARGRDFELTAAELGARPTRVFVSITLPLLRQGIITGAILCFARSLGEFGATLTFAGSLSGVTRTMPLQIYLVRESDPRSAIALSLLLIVVALVIIVIAYRSPHAPKLDPARGMTTVDGPTVDGPTVEGPAVDLPEPTPVRHRKSPPSDLAEADRGDGIRLQARLAERGIDVDLALPGSSTTALIGRNGAGKSSLFSILTGALTADSGLLRIGESTIFDVDAGRWPPVHARGIVHLGQNPLLFPHLTVVDNVAFGLRAHGAMRAAAREAAQEMLDRLGVGHLSQRRPDAVSGGQAARIALARALVIDPQLLLLDEPLAALDVDVKVETRRVLAQELHGRSAVLITHDVEDVTALAETLVLIESGRVALVAPVGAVEPAPGEDSHDFLSSFCAMDRDGILCSRSQ